MRSLSRHLLACAVAGLLLIATGCTSTGSGSAGASSAGAPASSRNAAGGTAGTVVTATFGQDAAAPSYDKALVPVGAKVLVAEYVFDGATTVTLNVRGLVPNRVYGAHAHAMACGATGEAAGPHFQHVPDPVKPSVDPAYANPANEIWLDFYTDAHGNATSAATVAWVFTDKKAASVIIHAEPTQTAPGRAGMAGARAACVSVGF